jgi:hypothetical protein
MRLQGINGKERRIYMKKISISLVLVFLVFNAFVVSVWAETIDFEAPLASGDIVSQVFGDEGSGPILVNGVNPQAPGLNAAVIFDSANPNGDPCGGGLDLDLGTPNETFGGPGVGAAGEAGSPTENDTAKGNILIINEACGLGGPTVDRPNDADVPGATLNFDFSALGSVTLISIFLIDVEAEETGAQVLFFDADNDLIRIQNLPDTGDNGVRTCGCEGPVNGVVRMEVLLNGSGAIDDIVFIPEEQPEPNIDIVKEVSVDGGATYFDANDAASAPETEVGSGALYRFIVTNTGEVDLQNVEINDAELGIVDYLVGNLAVGQIVELTSDQIPQLDQPGRCQEPGEVTNVATVNGEPVGGGDPVMDSDPAVVLCGEKPPCINGLLECIEMTVFESKPCLGGDCVVTDPDYPDPRVWYEEAVTACEVDFKYTFCSGQEYFLSGIAYGTQLNLALLKACNEGDTVDAKLDIFQLDPLIVRIKWIGNSLP